MHEAVLARAAKDEAAALDTQVQKAKRTGSGNPEPMRLGQGLLPCQFMIRCWPPVFCVAGLAADSNSYLTRFLHANRKSTSLENAM
ncbi:hypothetical protein JQ609_07670 [Bradyrhizobium sp. AUGA SZCCT0169]|uniref:hypothetical protein n=1 Tax=Bradyrhizobium sp. AUGA SZCCT0169 TaxID=2807663 RepID=UPI001BA7FE21|nr:hypothetical protein [Bradyrhizobium sp. AUGA SZCCT0169]MBR1246809.1 hypothetical protein [Bradyrhizobium sp. AUGA SZCCT0169]